MNFHYCLGLGSIRSVNTNASLYSVTALLLFSQSIVLTINHIYQEMHTVGLQTIHKV